MNALEKTIAFFSPRAAVKRHAARSVLAYYEAGEPSRLRNFYRQKGTQNEQVQRSAVAIRTQARHLSQNHDISRGVLRGMVNNCIGPKGVGVEPQPRRKDGSIHKEYAADLMEAHRDWCRKPEVTHRFNYSRTQRMLGWDFFRDGEVFGQQIVGERADINHGTRVPFSLELFEADLVPLDLNNETLHIVQGIERNGWGKPVAVHVLKTNPHRIGTPYVTDTKRIPWERVLHWANIEHFSQVRGMSEFASIITRLEDIKDYEESERIAAKIAAMLTAFVKKGTPDTEYTAASGPREINFQPGMVIDDLVAGEDIGVIDSKRPNPNLITFRQGQLKAVAAGFGGSYSSISKSYDGTYSAQRQEMVEQWINYAVLTDDFTGAIVQPNWETFVQVAHLSGVVRIPKDIKPGTHDDAIYVAQAMPWIDPLKEALGWEMLVKAGFASEIEVMRKRGVNPWDVLQQTKTWRDACEKEGVGFSTNEVGLEKLLAVAGQE